MVERVVNNCKECRASLERCLMEYSRPSLQKLGSAWNASAKAFTKSETPCHSTAQTPTHSGFQATSRGVQIEARDEQGSIAQVHGHQCAVMHGFNNMLESDFLGKKQGNQKKASQMSPNYLECVIPF